MRQGDFTEPDQNCGYRLAIEQRREERFLLDDPPNSCKAGAPGVKEEASASLRLVNPGPALL